MHALPAAAPPAPQRQVLVGMSLAVVAMFMLTGSMIAVWLLQRDNAKATEGQWLPDGVTIPEVPTNVMLISFAFVCIFAQWAVWSARRQDRGHTVFALGCTALVSLLIINAQAYTYHQMELPIADGTYAAMFYALTGMFMALMIAGVTMTVVVAFRYLGGRTRDQEIVVGHALYWYAVSVVFAVIWFYVYVSK
jgi:heme/copper-type cytochrome/quinol oxidase subunit 3